MGLEAIISIAIVFMCLAFLIFTRVPPDVVLMGGVTILITLRIIPISDALAGFSNNGLLTVGIMFIIAAGLKETGALEIVTRKIFGRSQNIRLAQLRIMLPVTAFSAFLNNTPIVASFIPAVSDWARKNKISVSKLMIPLSYASILGGTITLIGTSTNLVVHGMLIEQTGTGFGFFDLAWVGIPCAFFGLIYIILFSKHLLPERRSAIDALSDPKEYTVEMIVEANSPLIKQTIERAGLRHLPGLFLIEIDRDGTIIPAPSPEEIILENDRLIFTGITESVVDLQKMRGLKPATDQIFKLDTPRGRRCLIEAVVSNRCPLIGKSIREGEFRTHYNAVVIGVAREGKRVNQKIGDIVLKPADTLLIEAHQSFIKQFGNSRDFLVVRRIEDSTPPKHEKAWIAWMILVTMVIVASLNLLSILNSAMIAAGLLIVTRCLNATNARRSIELQVIVVIAAAFGIGKALETSGAAYSIATGLLSLLGNEPLLLLAGIYLITTLLTEMITNNAAAIIMFPIAYATTSALGLNFMPFAIGITMAASASFSTPIGYQTNLMVYGPGGYRFKDYLKLGVPLNIMMAVITITIAPLIWPFYN
ncbi:MAG: SLC13 family permease [Ignavibacteriaceae bacterium]